MEKSKIRYDDLELLQASVYCGLEPAGIFYEEGDGSYHYDSSAMIPPDTVIYVEMCERAEEEGLFHNGTDLYYNLLSLRNIFDNFLGESKVRKLTVEETSQKLTEAIAAEESNALYLLTDFRAVNEYVAADIKRRIIKGEKVSHTDIRALNNYISIKKTKGGFGYE